MEKIGKFLDRWGYYILALLCSGAILLSALWTNQQRAQAIPDAQALADESQRLMDMETKENGLLGPAPGQILRPFSSRPIFFEGLNIWQPHEAIDFSAAPGEPIYALADGKVALEERRLCIYHEDGRISLYRGLQSVEVQAGEQVKAGDVLGTAGGRIPFEGNGGHVCIQILKDGAAMDFSDELAAP